MATWHRWKYHNLTLAVIGLVVTLLISRLEIIHTFLLSLGGLGYIGAFFAGALFVSTFTAPTGAILLLIFAEKLTLWELGIVAGLGGVIGDLIIFKVVRNNLSAEIEYLYEQLGGHHLKKVWQSPYFSWTLPVIGAALLASPLPDELGVSLIGLTKMRTWQFLLVSFAMNVAGVVLVIIASNWIKP